MKQCKYEYNQVSVKTHVNAFNSFNRKLFHKVTSKVGFYLIQLNKTYSNEELIMDNDVRYQIDNTGSIVKGVQQTLHQKEREKMISELFTRNNWEYIKLDEITPAHYHIKLSNRNLHVEHEFHLFHGNIRKEDPKRSHYEKKIQLGSNNDPRNYPNSLILGFYVYEEPFVLENTLIVAWPVEENKNYDQNPSLRVNVENELLPAKNNGYYIDTVTGKNIVAFRPEFIYHYINNTYPELHKQKSIDLEENRIAYGNNLLVYGVPGAGKSWFVEHEYCSKETHINRVVFHPDYTNADFIGQILPIIDKENDKVSYDFQPGPFTTIMKEAYLNPDQEFTLIIEEINRGNASAIFGETFQLLDRIKQCRNISGTIYQKGTSEYSISNRYMSNIIYNTPDHEIRIPSNLTLVGTMNTSDQNVYTLDTAFQRRWEMHLIENSFDAVPNELSTEPILDTGVEWQKFCEVINKYIIANKKKYLSSEDKRLGVYFVDTELLQYDSFIDKYKDKDLYATVSNLLKLESSGNIDKKQEAELYTLRSAIRQNGKFPEKVLKYLWDDVFKLNTETIFSSSMDSLEKVIHDFIFSYAKDRLNVFNDTVKQELIN